MTLSTTETAKKRRQHTQSFSVPATGFVTPSGRHRICVGFDAETMAALNRAAKARGRSVSSTAADIVKMVLAAKGDAA
jgi:hypothetical protein